MRDPSGQGTRRAASRGVCLRVQPGPLVSWCYRSRQRLPFGVRPGKYVEHGEQAQRSHGGPIACFDRQVGRVEDGRGCSGRLRRIGPLSRPRSSNRTCGFPASGSPTGFLPQAVAGGGPRCIRRRRTTPNLPNTTWRSRTTPPPTAGKEARTNAPSRL